MSDPCYCIALRSAARKMTSIYDEALAPVGVNIAQFSLLRRVDKAALLSLTELGRSLELDRSTVGRNVRLLERAGFVRVSRGADQREATVALTNQGMAALRDGAPLWDRVQKRIKEGLEPRMIRQVVDAIENL
jgi:DNA-binding MarR family transcriptional regulator